MTPSDNSVTISPHNLALLHSTLLHSYPVPLTGLFESKFLLGGGGGGQFDPPPPPSDLGPKGADRREILHGCQDTCKEYCYDLFLAENGFIYYVIMIYAN